jgi:hypothetical protein
MQSEKSELLLIELERRAAEGPAIDAFKQLLAKCRALLLQADLQGAAAAFGEAQKVFSMLPDDIRINYSEECSGLFKEITAATKGAEEKTANQVKA